MATKDIASKATQSAKNVPDEAAVDHNAPVSEDNVKEVNSPDKIAPEKTVTRKKVGVVTSFDGKKIARPDPKGGEKSFCFFQI